ncbi:hypothetical protein ACE10X_21225 [Bradyrhizobium sp. Pha-3]|uniref:hypothetical protein n=1 Tax=Bradyrhizobium sp. Pha-3 TaxID=208375 RepID=UPI0035D3F9A2
MATSTKKPVDNSVHPNAHEVSACTAKMISAANMHKEIKIATTKETTAYPIAVM